MSDKLGIAAFSAMGAGTSWFMGDPRWFAMTAIPVLRSAGNATKLNAALRPTPSTWGQTASEIARLPQRSIPALLSSGNQ